MTMPDWIYPVALVLFVGGGAAYCWKYPAPPAPPWHHQAAEIEELLRRVPKPPSWMMQRFGHNWVDDLFGVIGAGILVVVFGGIFLILLVIGLVNLFSMSEHELVTLLIVMACITVISGGFKQ